MNQCLRSFVNPETAFGDLDTTNMDEEIICLWLEISLTNELTLQLK